MTITQDLFSEVSSHPESVSFEATRQAGLARLEQFVSRTGSHYASQRNYDLGPSHRSTVSTLSPWIRHRLITEEEVLTHTLARHSPNAAMKFIQEVFWRGYFKGWLEQYPSVWHSYLRGLQTAQNQLESDIHQYTDYRCAIDGTTGIECFDHWCRELKETGYLHNHTRMWFASIWIFTLRMPWELGAQFFLNHLIDGDPASNTLSWRWVGGLHTKGKTYLARPCNIAKYTNGKFEPTGQLALTAQPLVEDYDHPFVPPSFTQPAPLNECLILVTPEDCNPENGSSPALKGTLGLILPKKTEQSERSHFFRLGAVEDAVTRLGSQGNVVATDDWITAIITAAEQAGTTQVVTPFACVGPIAIKLAAVQDALVAAGITLHQHQRPYDAATWPHATKGFFKLKKMIPSILSDLGYTNAQNA